MLLQTLSESCWTRTFRMMSHKVTSTCSVFWVVTLFKSFFSSALGYVYMPRETDEILVLSSTLTVGSKREKALLPFPIPILIPRSPCVGSTTILILQLHPTHHILIPHQRNISHLFCPVGAAFGKSGFGEEIVVDILVGE